MIHLHTLGETLITVGEKEVRPSAPLVFAALLYLGVERGRRVPRAALQELFFPESDERSGSHSVRQLLYKLRQLGVPVEADDSTVSLPPTSVIDSCVIDHAATWSDRDAAVAALGFVPEYEPYISERFSHWLEQQRTVTATQLRAALVALLLARRSQANWRGVTAIAQSLLLIDPLNDEATLALAEATAAMGSKQRAMAILTAYESETHSTLRLAPALLRKRISETLEAYGPENNVPGELIGRTEEVTAIVRRVAQPTAFGKSVSLIVGEAGIGKTRLLEEIVRSAGVTGTRPLLVGCRAHHKNRPLSAFIELVPVLLQSPGALGVNPDALKYLRTLVHTDSDTVPSHDFDDDTGRVEVLRRAISDLVDAVCSESDVVLALEDVHWCDSASLVELRLIASRFPSLPIVCTSRSLEGIKHHFEDIADVFRLKPLSRDEMLLLAQSFVGRSDKPELGQWCAEVAAGNPLFLRILCRHAVEAGSRAVPSDLKALISSRLILLPDSLLRALHYVALLGPHASLTALQELLGVAPPQFVECVAYLEDEGYLTIREGRLCMSHDLVSEVALSITRPLTKTALHARVASFLEHDFESTGNTSVLWDCAEQWRLSGEQEKSVELLRRCAGHASAVGHSGRALEIMSYARQLLTDNQKLPGLLKEMIHAAKAAGQLTDIQLLVRQLQSLEGSTHCDTEIIGLEAEWLLSERFDVSRLLNCVESEELSTHHRLEACLLLLRYAHENCDAPLAHRGFGSIMGLLPSADPTDRLLLELVYHETFGDVSTGLAFIDALIELTPRLSVSEQLRVTHNIVIGLLIGGRVAQAIERADEQRARVRVLGLTTREYEFTALICACYLATEDYANGERWMSQLGSPPDSRWAGLHTTLSVEMALWRKDREAAADLLQSLKSTGFGRMARDQMYLGGANLRLKQLDQHFVCSESEFEELVAVYDRCKAFITEDGLARALAEDLRRRNRIRDAAAILDDYVNNARRQCRQLPESFTALRAQLDIEASALSVA